MQTQIQQGKSTVRRSENGTDNAVTGSTLAWAVEDPEGRVLADSTFRDEAHAWQVALGWPSQDEIDHAKKRGYKAYLAEIRKPVANVKKNVDVRTPGTQGNLL